MHYNEITPSRPLRDYVRCYWHLESSGNAALSGVDSVVPDGCAEIILNRADLFRRHCAGTSHLQAQVLLVGQITRAIQIQATGSVDLIGIRFEPHGLNALLGIPMHELVNVDVCLAQVDAGLHRQLVLACERTSLVDQIASIEAALLAKFAQRTSKTTRSRDLVTGAVSFMNAPSTTDQIAARLGVSRRTLQRTFRERVGLSPKLYSRIQKLQRVIRHIDSGGPVHGWTDVALTHGYFDQSHLIRDFRLIARTTPDKYLDNQTPIDAALAHESVSHSSNP